MLRNLEKGKCQGSDLNRRQIPTTAPLDCRSRSSASLTCVSSALHSPFMVRLSYLGSLRAVLGINISLSGLTPASASPIVAEQSFLADNIRAFAKIGKAEEARRLLAELEERPKEEEYVNPSGIAVILFVLGEVDRGFEWLEKAYEGHDG